MTISKDNVFADLGLADSEEMKVRSDLLSELVHIIRISKLSDQDVAVILEIGVPQVTALLAGKINDFTTHHLRRYLSRWTNRGVL